MKKHHLYLGVCMVSYLVLALVLGGCGTKLDTTQAYRRPTPLLSNTPPSQSLFTPIPNSTSVATTVLSPIFGTPGTDIAPSFEYIRQRAKQVDWNTYKEELAGKRVEGWTGWVLHTYENREKTSTSLAFIDMDDPESAEGRKRLSEVALLYPKTADTREWHDGQGVTFSGNILSVLDERGIFIVDSVVSFDE